VTSLPCLLLPFNDRSCSFNGDKTIQQFYHRWPLCYQERTPTLRTGMFMCVPHHTPHHLSMATAHPHGRRDAAVGGDTQHPVHTLEPPLPPRGGVFSTGSCRSVASTQPARRRDGNHLGLPGTRNPGTILDQPETSSGNHRPDNCPVTIPVGTMVVTKDASVDSYLPV